MPSSMGRTATRKEERAGLTEDQRSRGADGEGARGGHAEAQGAAGSEAGASRPEGGGGGRGCNKCGSHFRCLRVRNSVLHRMVPNGNVVGAHGKTAGDCNTRRPSCRLRGRSDREVCHRRQTVVSRIPRGINTIKEHNDVKFTVLCTLSSSRHMSTWTHICPPFGIRQAQTSRLARSTARGATYDYSYYP